MPINLLKNDHYHYRRVAQGSEQSAYIRPVVGSIPTPPTNANDRKD